MRHLWAVTLLSGATLVASPARGQQAAAVSQQQAEIEQLRAQLQELQRTVADLQKAQVNATPSWKGAPELSDKDAGLSFKPKGLAQFDVGRVGRPVDGLAGTVGPTGTGVSLNTGNLGFNARARRLSIGAEGTLGGGFGYNIELNFGQGQLDYDDVLLTYQPKGSPIQVRVGNMFPLSSLETMTSSRVTSFLERASFIDAFNHNRRLGLAAAYVDPKDRWTLTGGLFSQAINDTAFNRTGWQASLRGTYSPMLGENRLHLGASYQRRTNRQDARNGRYRSRPATQLTDQRLVDTGQIAADGDQVAGIELGFLAKSLHVAAEGQRLWVRGYRPGRTFGGNDGVGSGTTRFYAGDPSFRGGYAEVGYYLTGETRGYKAGRWDRTKVLKPVGDGGIGAVQLLGRIDLIDLSDRVDGATLTFPDFVNGGRQVAYQLGVNWLPSDYVRFSANYGRVQVSGGALSALIEPNSGEAVDRPDYGIDVFAARAQFEF